MTTALFIIGGLIVILAAVIGGVVVWVLWTASKDAVKMEDEE